MFDRTATSGSGSRGGRNQSDTPARRRPLRRAGFRVGVGSYSDIADLDFLCCSGFNFGTGYHRQHTSECYADLGETREMVERFVRFWVRYRNMSLPHRGKWDEPIRETCDPRKEPR